ncbi:MAG: Intein-containing protein [Parcubacteria group bacterium GW2011_GWB1_56_8]|nr:MAG: Intein-containing protein [Parcubacteria group bacterium GW2011_GWB1_56_8]
MARKLPFKNFEWGPNLAYAVGLLTTDGCLSNDGRHIIMRSAEVGMLRTFSKCLNLTNNICKTDGGKGYRIQFGAVRFYNWLAKIGLTPAKTHTLGAIAVPDVFFRDFLRGHLDGDGSIRFYNDQYNVYRGRTYNNLRLSVRFISASKSHITWLQKRVNELTKLHGALICNKPSDKNRVPIWEIKFSKKESVRLLNWIYYEPALPSLERKRLSAMKALAEIAREQRKEYTMIES